MRTAFRFSRATGGYRLGYSRLESEFTFWLKPQTTYVCGDCGAATIKWQGQCPACGEWNALRSRPGRPLGPRRSRGSWAGAGAAQELAEVGEEQVARRSTGIARARPGARRRARVRLRHADRRRPGHRQVDAAAAGLRRAERGRRCCTSAARNRVQQIALRARRLGIDADGVTVSRRPTSRTSSHGGAAKARRA